MYGRAQEWTQTIRGVEVEVGTLVGRNTDAAKVVRFTKTQAVCHRVYSNNPGTEKTDYQGKPIEMRLTLDHGYYNGGLEIGSRQGRHSRHWEVTDAATIQERWEAYLDQEARRDAKRERDKAKKQVELAQATGLLGNLSGSVIPGPFAVRTVTFESPRERYGEVQFLYTVEDTEGIDWGTGEMLPMKKVYVTAWHVDYPGEKCERVGHSNHGEHTAKTVRDALAEVVVSWYL